MNTVLILLLCLLYPVRSVTDTNGAPARTRLATAGGATENPYSHGKKWKPLETLQQHFFPPIPKQEQKHLTLLDQFNPKYIQQEFLLGIMYLVKSFPCVLGANVFVTPMISTVFTVLSKTGTLCKQAVPPLKHACQMTILHDVGNFIVIKFCPTRRFLGDVVFIPMFEECGFRILAHGLGRFSALMGLRFFIYSTRLFHNTHAAILLCGGLYAIWLVLLLQWSKGSLFLQATQILSLGVHAQLVFAMAVELIRTANNEPNGLLKADSMGCVVDEALSNKVIQKAISFSGQWYGASEFAYGHIPIGPLTLAQKVFGIQAYVHFLCDSLLLKGRLAVNRQNIWGCIGAHMAWNLLGPRIWRLACWNSDSLFETWSSDWLFETFGHACSVLVLAWFYWRILLSLIGCDTPREDRQSTFSHNDIKGGAATTC